MRQAQAPTRWVGARAASSGADLGSWVFAQFALALDFFRALVSAIFRMPSSLLGLAMPASTSAAALQETLENAGRLIDRQLQEDRMYPDLSELLMVSAPSE